MVTIAHTADLHITDRSGDSGATLQEQVEILRWIGNDAAAAGAAAMLCAGDVFDRASTPAERNAAIEVFTGWAELMPVIVVRGNHDRPTDLLYLARLRTRHEITVCERADVVELPDLVVACLPWPSKAALVAATGADSRDGVDAAARGALTAILAGFAARFDREAGRACVLLAHCELTGATMDSGQPVGAEADLPLAAGDLLDVGADYVALGHIHKHQSTHGRICYAGSPRQCTFGEVPGHGYCLVDVQRGESPAVEGIQGPGHELITIEARWKDAPGPECAAGLVAPYDDETIAGASLRLIYEVAAEHREEARRDAEDFKAHWLTAGARSVKIDATTTPEHRVRSEEIRKARTVADKVQAYWSSNGGRPARAIEQLDKLSVLEREGVTP